MPADHTTHPEYLALLRGILENPADDAPRMILSDWLEENDQRSRAEFLRHQLGLPHSCAEPYYTDTPFPLSEWPDSGSSLLDLTWDGEWTRGFVSHVRISCEDFLEKAARLFASHPVTSVAIIDKQPFRMSGSPVIHGWQRWSVTSKNWPDANEPRRGYGIPDVIFDLMPGHEYAPGSVRYFDWLKAAETALSDACVHYGRTLVGLPPLPG